jgi:hypothetical protein
MAWFDVLWEKFWITVMTWWLPGDNHLPGLTDTEKPRMRGPKRATKIRKLFNLTKEDDVRKYVNTYRRTFVSSTGEKLNSVFSVPGPHLHLVHQVLLGSFKGFIFLISLSGLWLSCVFVDAEFASLQVCLLLKYCLYCMGWIFCDGREEEKQGT